LEISHRRIDHLVLPVTTLSLARSRMVELGFTVAPDARHPFGTGNCCIFFRNRTYLEPVTIVDRTTADISAAEGVVFVRLIKRFTERHGEGFAMLALKSDDAERDAANLAGAGIKAGPVYRFHRIASLPGGEQREIGFATVFIEHPAMRDATVFAIQHLAPEALFQAAYMDHVNGATGIAAVVAVARDPAEFQALLARVGGNGDDAGLSEAPRAEHSRFTIMTPSEFCQHYGVEPPDPRHGLRFAAFEIGVEDVERARRHAGAGARIHEGCAVVPPSPGLGAVMAFRSGGDG
jgi:hypothetical protein